ncbi:MAG: replication restart helicase PriA [Bryobacteraceae bacterium]
MSPRYCDVGVPAPVDQLFTYELPETLRHRVQPGCRLIVPFGSRKLTGMAVRCHDEPPAMAPRQALRLVDEEPALDKALLGLAEWIAGYYCAPIGEVLRSMTPVSAEIRRGRVYTLTDQGRDAARQLLLGVSAVEPAVELMRLLEARPLSENWITKKIPNAARLLRTLIDKGLVAREDTAEHRDPLRAPSARLRVEFIGRPEGVKLKKAEREVLSYLELHPGTHLLSDVEGVIPGAGVAARSMARRALLKVEFASSGVLAAPFRPPHSLNAHQQAAFEAIRACGAARKFGTFLLQGVTGSGKTEVYLRAIEETIAGGRGALLLVPEIALTPAVAGQFLHRFGERVAILHSAFSDSERVDQWRRIRSGHSAVVVGTRSGVFAPVRDLGLIIVDEEHDHSYKQEETPRYNGRDVAIVRGQAMAACVVLGSATARLESRYNAERGKYTLLDLPERIEKRPMPAVELIDMRQEFLDTRRQATFSRRLAEAVQDRLASGEQTMLLLNRRGYSSFVTCRSCGERVQCRDCSVTLTYHRRDRRMLCHYCNFSDRVPDKCPSCGSEYIHFIGAGSERVEDELHRLFPQARIARMDRDTVTGRRRYETILHSFREKEYDILVGTQMIAKGHDIPNVTLVGVVSGDTGLGMPDFRAAERTFQLLTQAAGRAGRGDLTGVVLIQTINPEHYAIRLAATQDYAQFYEKEIQFRRLMYYPPFTALANVLLRSGKQEEALAMSTELGHYLTPSPEQIKVIGPAEAPVVKLMREYRYQLLIKSTSRKTLTETLRGVRRFAQDRKWPAAALVIDVDPRSLM